MIVGGFMAGSKTDSYEQKILNLMRQEALEAWTPYVALFTDFAEESGEYAEVELYGYERQLVEFSEPEGTQDGFECSNVSLVRFPVLQGSGEEVVAIGYFDSAEGGELRYYDNTIAPVTINANTVIQMEPGNLKIKED